MLDHDGKKFYIGVTIKQGPRRGRKGNKDMTSKTKSQKSKTGSHEERRWHCSNCWEDITDEPIHSDYKGTRYQVCPLCGERSEFAD